MLLSGKWKSVCPAIHVFGAFFSTNAIAMPDRRAHGTPFPIDPPKPVATVPMRDHKLLRNTVRAAP